LKYGRVRNLHGVLHIPYLAMNIISVGNMVDEGVHVVFKKEKIKMV
jgi:hypothetical protein